MQTFTFDELIEDDTPSPNEAPKGLENGPAWFSRATEYFRKGGKSEYSAEQSKYARTGIRMLMAHKELLKLEKQFLESNGESGYDPRNVRDRFAQNSLSIIDQTPIGRFIMTNEGQNYMRNMEEFTQAQLRDETGAVINESEMVMISRRYIPVLGDSFETVKSKIEAREVLINALKAVVGDKLWGEALSKQNVDSHPSQAREADVISRIKNSKEFRQKFKERFPLQYKQYENLGLI